MGRYIGGPAGPKKTMEENGAQPIPPPRAFTEVPVGTALVVLVDNGSFMAAGWVFDAREFQGFTDPTDPRPRSFWLMDLDTVRKLTGS